MRSVYVVAVDGPVHGGILAGKNGNDFLHHFLGTQAHLQLLLLGLVHGRFPQLREVLS
jgi:hypothetical protein